MKQDRQGNCKFSETTKEMMKKRRQFGLPKTQMGKIEYAEMSKVIKRMQRQDIKDWTARYIEDLAKMGKGLKLAKKRISPKHHIFEIKDTDGSSTTDKERILSRTKEFYEKLYHSSTLPANDQSRNKVTVVPDVTSWEVKAIVNKMKSGKAAGASGINIDLIKSAGMVVCKQLATIFTQCLNQQMVPAQWEKSVIMLIHKKGDQRDLGNYRPISLLETLYKLFTKLITDRIAKTIDYFQPREQAGFRHHFSTVDHLHTLNIILQKTSEHRIPLAIAFIDYKKAFDSVISSKVMDSLRVQGIEEAYIRTLEYIYNNSWAVIRLEKESESFKILRGVRQGDPISPSLFTSCLELVFQQLDWDQKGIRIDGEYLNNLRFADDIVLLANNVNELQGMVEDLNKESKKVGLEMNLDKTVYLINRNIDQTSTGVTVNGVKLKRVDEYTYLGQIITENGSSDKEITRRIGLCWRQFGEAHTIFKSKRLSVIHKRKIYNKCILPTLTYGAQTWTVSRGKALKIQGMQRAHERIMLGITLMDHVRAEEIRQKTKVIDALELIGNLKWKWAGRLMRTKDNRWAKKVTEWMPRGWTRAKGRPRQRWSDDLDKFKKNWQRYTEDKNYWNVVGKTYSLQLRKAINSTTSTR